MDASTAERVSFVNMTSLEFEEDEPEIWQSKHSAWLAT